MARSAVLTALAAAVLMLVPSASAVEPDELTFPQLRDTWNTTRQWRLGMATSHSGGAFVPVNCSNPTLNACVSTNPPLEQGDVNDRLMVNWTMFQTRLNGTLATYKGMMPTKIQIRACFSLNTSVDRAWRRKNKPYPRLSQNCPRKLVTYPFNGTLTNPDFAANSGSFVWELNKEDEVPVSTWFLMMWVYCGDDQVCAFESTEGRNDVSPPVAGNFIQTNVQMGITPGMRAAAIILSIFSPLFFICFLTADHFYYKKTGKAIVLF